MDGTLALAPEELRKFVKTGSAARSRSLMLRFSGPEKAWLYQVLVRVGATDLGKNGVQGKEDALLALLSDGLRFRGISDLGWEPR